MNRRYIVIILVLFLTSCQITHINPPLLHSSLQNSPSLQVSCRLLLIQKHHKQAADCLLLLMPNEEIFFSASYFLTGNLFSLLRKQDKITYWNHLKEETCSFSLQDKLPAKLKLLRWNKQMWTNIITGNIAALKQHGWQQKADNKNELEYFLEDSYSIQLTYTSWHKKKKLRDSLSLKLSTQTTKETIILNDIKVSKKSLNLEQILHIFKGYKKVCFYNKDD